MANDAPARNGTAKQPVVCVLYDTLCTLFVSHADGHSCGASEGKSPVHMAAARSLAEALHKSNTRLVYGGGTVGLMGEVARTLVALSGPDSVHGTSGTRRLTIYMLTYGVFL